MNKGIVIGVIALVIIAVIIGVASSLNLESYDESIIDNNQVEETSPVEEIVMPETAGRNLSVELTESVGISSNP